MSKKTNTIWFILGATLFNVLTTIVSFVVLLLVFTQVVNMTGIDGEAASSWGVPVIFVGAIVASFFIYRVTLKQIQKKVDMEKHFDPLFGPRRNVRKPTD